jgi:hypothetical protein
MQASILVVVVLVVQVVSTTAVAANYPDPVKVAKKVGFSSCAGAISKTFADYLEPAERGLISDAHINVDYFGDDPDAARITVLYGEPGDMVVMSAVVRAKGDTCESYRTATVYGHGACPDPSFSKEEFRVASQSHSIKLLKNRQGVTAIEQMLKGGACVTIYQTGFKHPRYK